MVEQNELQRKIFWDEVKYRFVWALNLDVNIRVPYDSKLNYYNYANVNYLGYSDLLNDKSVSIVLSVACKAGENSSIPKLKLVFDDRGDTSRRDMVFKRLKRYLPEYHCGITNLNADGESKVIVRRKKEQAKAYTYTEEAKILVDILFSVIEVIVQLY